jgi:ubiquinone/menaquinone biosynthesis C-methylase UbiE
VIDIGSGARLDSLIAARMVSPNGKVVGVDMTQAMLEKARRASGEAGIDNVEFRHGYAETLPFEDAWADAVTSNGVLNLIPDKVVALQEMARVLKPGGRLQIAERKNVFNRAPQSSSAASFGALGINFRAS